MTLSKNVVWAFIAAAVGAFFVGRMTAVPSGPQTYDDGMLEVTKSPGANRYSVADGHYACLSKFGPRR